MHYVLKKLIILGSLKGNTLLSMQKYKKLIKKQENRQKNKKTPIFVGIFLIFL